MTCSVNQGARNACPNNVAQVLFVGACLHPTLVVDEKWPFNKTITNFKVSSPRPKTVTRSQVPSMSLAVSTPSPSTPAQHAAPSTPTPRNPITLRLRKILGTTFTDPATTEALQTLSYLYSTPSVSDAAIQSLEHNADGDNDDSWSDLDSEGTAPRDGISGHSDVANETAARVRKNLQRDLENKLAEGSQHFLKAFGEVDQVCR